MYMIVWSNNNRRMPSVEKDVSPYSYNIYRINEENDNKPLFEIGENVSAGELIENFMNWFNEHPDVIKNYVKHNGEENYKDLKESYKNDKNMYKPYEKPSIWKFLIDYDEYVYDELDILRKFMQIYHYIFVNGGDIVRKSLEDSVFKKYFYI